MAIKILTQNGVDNTNIDGARTNNFNAGNRSGFVKGAFNDGRIFASTTNTIALDTCELRLSGHQIVITEIIQQILTMQNKQGHDFLLPQEHAYTLNDIEYILDFVIKIH